MEFSELFKNITGNTPYPWQQRLYQSFLDGKIPTYLDIPTGLGKTSIMVIWLIAKAKSKTDNNIKIPTRLIYIVDRRVIVDQATDEAQNILEKINSIPDLKKVSCLSISKFRGGGGTSDSRDWLRYPEEPAIIVGTIDMIGSRLFFSGYGISHKLRSFYAGLLGQDSLILLDETHLSPAMMSALKDMHKNSQNTGQDLFPPRVMFMSATQPDKVDQNDVFTLNLEDLKNDRIKKRYEAKKNVEIINIGKKEDKLKTVKECSDKIQGRILIYLQKPKDVKDMANLLKKDGKEAIILTGTLRGYERDKLAENDIWKSFLSNNNTGSNKSSFLVSTSAGEVGVDLDADHMICDISTFDALVQRLGRVNRSGGRNSKIFIIYSDDDLKKSKISESLTKTKDLLVDLTKDGTFDASPSNISKIPYEQKEGTFLPPPEIQPLTIDILEMLALTSLHKQYSSRPEIHYWLRGKEKQSLPETQLVWREDVKHIVGLKPEKIQDVLDHYRILPHEIAHDYSHTVYKFLNSITENSAEKAIIIKSNGDCVSKAIGDIDKDEIAFATIILPCHVGGLDPDGFINKSGKHVTDVADNKKYLERTRLIIEHNINENTHQVLENIQGNEINEELDKWTRNNPLMLLLEQIKIEEDNEEIYKEIQYYAKRAEQQQSRSTKEQTLQDHHTDTENASKKITKAMILPKTVKEAVILASKFHDEGKAREHWQTCMHVQGDKPLAKTGRNKRPLNMDGFRHEFASVVECIDRNEEIKDHSEKDLILHLIASHHGWARPCFMPEVIHHEKTSCKKETKEIFEDVMRRYHKLQKRFGVWGLAWLEGLVRGADWYASENPSGG